MTTRRFLERFGVVALTVALVPALAAAAPSPPAPRGGSRSPDASAGYSYAHAGEANLHGWQLTASFLVGLASRVLRGDGVWDSDPRLSLAAAYRFGRR